MTRQQIVLNNFKKNFDIYLKEKILIYGKGLYAKLIIENFKEYSFIGIIDRLDLEGSYYGIPVLKYDEVIESNAKIIIIAASIRNTEIIRKRIGNFCKKYDIKLYSADGNLLNVDDCIISVPVHETHEISQKKLEENIYKYNVICFDLESLLIGNYGCSGVFFTVREALINNLIWAEQQGKRTVLYVKSTKSLQYLFLYSLYQELCDKLVVYEEQNQDVFTSLYKLRSEDLNNNTYLFVGGEKCDIAKTAGFSTFRIYTPIEMLLNSTYRNLFNDTLSVLEQTYLHVIVNHIFSSPYALEGTQGLVQVKSDYDIGYIFLGPIVLDFMFWFITKVRQNEIKNVIFSARDGYLFQKIYTYIAENFNLDNLPQSTYLYVSRRVCNMIRINCESDIVHLAAEYFHGNINEMLINRFMLTEEEIYERRNDSTESDLEYIKNYTSKILDKAAYIKKKFLKYLESSGIEFSENTIFFDLFASGTCQLALSKLCNKELTGLYFSRFFTDEPEKAKLKIESYLESDPFMEDHSLFIESILTSLEPTLWDIGNDGQPLLGKETRSKSELDYVKNVQDGIFLFVKDALKCIDRIPDIKRDYARNIFSMITSQYTNIDNYIFKNMIIRDEVLNRDQYLGDFYKY